MCMNDSWKEHAHGRAIRYSHTAMASRMPGRPRNLPPVVAPFGNLYGPLCPHLLPPGTLATCPDLCLWPALGSGTQKRRGDRVSLRTRSPPPATLRRLGRGGCCTLAAGTDAPSRAALGPSRWRVGVGSVGRSQIRD